MRRPAAILLCALSLSALAAGEGLRYRRPLPVAAPGWTAVELDLTTLGHAARDLRDLRVLDPAGREIPYALRVVPQQPGSRRASLVSVSPDAEGWALIFDLGPDACRHDRFRLLFDNRATLPGCRLEGGPDGRTWHGLAAGNLFVAGASTSVQATALAYPPSADRFLRLRWPRAAGFPEVKDAYVELVPAALPSLRAEDVAAAAEPPDGASADYRVTLPGPGLPLVGLGLRWDGAGAVGYRLMAPQQGAWRTVAEGTLARPREGAWPSIPLGGAPLGAPTVRLVLFAGGDARVRLTAVTANYLPVRLVFYASAAGSYALAYGGVGLARPDYPPVPTDRDAQAREVIPGPESERVVRLLAASTAGPGAAMPAGPFAARWPVQAPGAKPGDLVRVELTPSVYGAARRDLGDLRIESEGLQVPFVRWTPPDPVAAVRLVGGRPAPVPKGRASELVLDAGQANLPLTALELSAPAEPFARTVSVYAEAPARPGLEAPTRIQSAWAQWTCDGEAPVPCQTTLALGPPGASRLVVRFEDGDNPPLPSVDAVLWRRRDVLLFAWPPSGRATLCAGDESLAAPQYDLNAVRDQLVDAPCVRAELVGAGATGQAGAAWVRWALLGALGAAGLLLLAILARALRGTQKDATP